MNVEYAPSFECVLKTMTGIDVQHVPYKGGAPAMIDVMAGRVSFIFIDPVQGMPHTDSRKNYLKHQKKEQKRARKSQRRAEKNWKKDHHIAS